MLSATAEQGDQPQQFITTGHRKTLPPSLQKTPHSKLQEISHQRVGESFQGKIQKQGRKRKNGKSGVFTHGFAVLNRKRIVEQAAEQRLPTMYGWREFVDEGGLMSYGANVPVMVRKAASYVDRIIKGEKPGDLPIEQPARLELIVNLKTAKTLGLEIPPALLALADAVVE